MRKRLVEVFAISICACCIIAAGTAFAGPVQNVLPSCVANSNQPVSGALNVAPNDGGYIGTFRSGGSNYDVYYDYQFDFTTNSPSIAYSETTSFCVDPATYRAL